MARPKKLPKFVKLVRTKRQPKSKFDLKAFSEVAAKSAAGKNEIGPFVELLTSEEGINTFLWEAKQPGYVGWRWSVSVFQADPAAEPTLDEVVLVPGPESLIAPNWIPWADRKVDQQTAEGELEHHEVSLDDQDDLAVFDLEQSEDAEQKSN